MDDDAPDSAPRTLVAYHEGVRALPVLPAPRERQWMRGPAEFAHRCLPMLIANQHGWHILNLFAFRASWDGSASLGAVRVEANAPEADAWVASHFGNGILTFTIPYLFHTSEGVNLLARGPANEPKHGIQALEGIIETDWSPATFTMNWKFTAPGTVEFLSGETICMIVPQERGFVESFSPAFRLGRTDNPALDAQLCAWRESRSAFLVRQKQAPYLPRGEDWQKDYFRGKIGAASCPAHQTKLSLRPFVVMERDDETRS